jgi:hypothetical protein
MKKPKKITDLRQSRQIGGLKTQDKFIRERIEILEWKVKVIGWSVSIFCAVVIMGWLA